MKKWLCFVLSLLMILGLTACGGDTPDEEAVFADEVTSIEAAKAALEAGAYETAYAYLITDESDEATALLKKLVFVPIKTTSVTQEKGMDSVTYTTEYTYDAKGNFLSMTEAGSDGTVYRQWTCTYDEQGRLLTSREEGGRNVRFYRGIPDENGLIVEQVENRTGSGTGEDYVVSRYRFNQENQLVSRAFGDEDLPEIEQAYDERGNVIKVVYDACVATMTYDEQDRLTSILVDDWSGVPKHWERKYTYTKSGERLETSSLLKEDDAYSNKVFVSETVTTYDENGNALSVINKEEKEEGISRVEVTYTYDEQGNCLSAKSVRDEPNKARSSGQQTYTYDEQGRLIKEQGTGDRWPQEFWVGKQHFEGGDYTREYTYDEQGRVSSQTIDHSVKYEFDDSDTVYEETVHYAIETTYDSAGNRTDSYIDKEGTPVYKTVTDSQGRSLEEWRSGGNGLQLEQSYQYDRFGNVVTAFMNDTATTTEWELKYYPAKSPYWFVLSLYDFIQNNATVWPVEAYGVSEELEKRLGAKPADVLGIEEEYFFLYGIV